MSRRAAPGWRSAPHPGVACLLNGRGTEADQARRRSRGELPLRAAADGAGVLKELADDPAALRAYDPFYLVCAVSAAAALLAWDGASASTRDLAPGTHLLTNAGHAYPPDPAHPDDPAGEPKAAALRAPSSPRPVRPPTPRCRSARPGATGSPWPAATALTRPTRPLSSPAGTCPTARSRGPPR